MLEIPEAVRNNATEAGATDWLAHLPELVADLCREWGLTTGRTYDGGTEAFVIDADQDDGPPAVLKLLVPRPGDAVAYEAIALRLADGDGCAQLLREDETRDALLLERLGPSLFDLGVPIGRRHEILCTAAEKMWRPAADCGLRSGATKGRWLIDEIVRLWDQLDRPCSERVIDHAARCAERRIAAHDDERAVLVHGDVHQWNALQAGDGFKLVDPDGLLAEAEYDLGIIMREDPAELVQGDPRERARWLAQRTGKDEAAIWEWGVVERVSTGLLCLLVDLQPFGDASLAAAEAVALLDPA